MTLSARESLASGDEEVRREAVSRLGEEEGALGLLVEAMGDASWRVRKEAVARAATWRARELAAAALVAALSEPENVGRRNAAVDGLAQLGGVAVEPLVTALAPRPEHRKLIVDALGLLGDRRATLAIAPLLDDDDANVRAASAEALGKIGGSEAAAALAHGLGRGELLLSVACLDGLNRLRAPIAVERLAPLLGTPVLRPAVVAALGQSGDERAVVHLVAALGDAGRMVRVAAISALGQLHATLPAPAHVTLEAALAELPDTAQPLLVETLLEADPAGRRSAALLLGLSHRADAVGALALALSDEDVEETAADAIARLGDVAVAPLCQLLPELDGELAARAIALLPRLVSAEAPVDARVAALLIDALDDEDGSGGAAGAAARALGALGGREAIAPLLRALGGAETVALAAAQSLGQLGARFYDEVRTLIAARGLSGPDARHLCRVLGSCGHPDDVTLLRPALHADQPAIRRAAAEAMASLGTAGETPASLETQAALCYLLADEAGEVRAAAARALGAMLRERAPSPGTVEALRGACRDADAPVRAAAARSLGLIGGPAAQSALRDLARAADAATAVHAVEALGRLGDLGDEELLLEALERGDTEVVKAAARALARWPGERALDGLARALGHGRWDVRRVAAEALVERHDDAARALLAERLAVEEDELVRQALGPATTATTTPPRRR